MSRGALLAAAMVSVALARASSRNPDEMPDTERKVPPPPRPAPVPPGNLPGETNRQFAARMAQPKETTSD